MNTSENQEVLQQLIGSDYQLQWIIGHGGMSTVWLADDTRHDREVAIKVLRPEFSDNSEFLSRFRYEAEAAEGINSDNVVQTYDYRELEDPAGHTFCFIVLEYVRGESLADLLARENQLPESLALDVLEQAAHGLSIIHRMGLVHRDIKPGNLLITQNGQVKITDFGIAKAAAAVPLTRTGMVVGTAQYVSPEQAQGQQVTASSDVYSLGVVGYEMLAGERPFTGDSSVSVALAHINQAPDPLSTAVPAEVRELIGIALRKDLGTRFADGDEFALAISAVRMGERPPQPQSAALAGPAPEPSPTAATQMLGDATNPTTIHPAATTAGPPTPPAGINEAEASSGGTGRSIGLGILLAVLAVLLVGGGFYAATTFMGDDRSETDPTSETPVVVTEWVEPETETSSESESTQPTQTEVTVETVTETSQEHSPAPEPQPAPQEPTQAPTQQHQAPGSGRDGQSGNQNGGDQNGQPTNPGESNPLDSLINDLANPPNDPPGGQGTEGGAR